MSATQSYRAFTHLPLAIALSLLATATLFILMQTLIDVDFHLEEVPKIIVTDPVLGKREEIEAIIEPPLQRPKEPEAAPEPIPEVYELDPAADSNGIALFREPTFIDPDITAGSGSSTIVPIFRVAPDYPASAIRRGIEGYVDLLFDINASGKTENIRVIASEPSGIFDRAALRALAKWKYKVPEIDGTAVGQRDMTTRIRFEMEQDG
ncbi:MAG: energy transducer TonB [Pseudomonadota bacterium]